MIVRVWRALKVRRKIRIGPIGLVFSFERLPRITKGVTLIGDGLRRVALRRGKGLVDGTLDAGDSSVASDCNSYDRRNDLAVVFGVGPGFGFALARRLAAEGFDLVLVSRRAQLLTKLAVELASHGGRVDVIGADATEERRVASVFESIESTHGIPALVVYAIQEFSPGAVIEVSVPAFESAWRHNCLGAFLVSRAAGKVMKAVGCGSILLIGSTSSLLGRAGHLNLAVGKFGQRALAQVLSRELWPHGIHVAHIVIDADIREPLRNRANHPQSDPGDIAETVLAIHRQPRSAWSSEIDLRPWNEKFWEHC